METDTLSSIFSDSFFTKEVVNIFVSVFILFFLFLVVFVSYCENMLIVAKSRGIHYTKYILSGQGKFLLLLLQNPHRPLFIFTTVRSFVNVIILGLFLYLIYPYAQGKFMLPIAILVILFSTVILFFFNEIIPKQFVKNELRRTIKLSKFVKIFSFFSKPLVLLFEALFQAQKQLSPNKKQELSIDELSKSMDLTNEEIDEGKDLLEGLIHFNDKSAVEIMTPREDMACLDISVSLPEIRQYVVETHYSRLPIYDKTEDNIRGILYVKDLIPYLENDTNYRWQQLIRSAYFVPETKKIDILLDEFRSNKIHLAIVVDEFGGTSGLVTMEDILEEIVGEISDEYDQEQKAFVQLADGSLIFDGKTLLTDFFRYVEVDESEFEDITEDIDTLAGLLLELKGDFPRRQEVITYKRYRFQVLEMSKRRIVKVKFSVLDEIPENDKK